MVINNEFEIGEIVYLKTCLEQVPRIVSSIEIFKGGELVYKLEHGTSSSYHYEFEMSKEKNYLLV